MVVAEIAVAALAVVGHTALGIWLFDRLHATRLGCRAVKRIEKGLALLWLALLVGGFVGWWGARPILLAAPEWPTPSLPVVELAGWTYAWLCAMLAAVVVPTAIVRRWRERPPAALAANRTEQYDVAERVDEPLVGSWVGRLALWIPGNEITHLAVQHKTLLAPQLPPTLDGFVLAHLSDLHFTGQLTPAYFAHVIDRAAEAQPDAAVLTGDVVDYAWCIEWIEPLLSRLRPPQGAYFVLGNHDHRVRDIARLRAALTDAGWIDLGGRWTIARWRQVDVLLAGNELPWLPPAPAMESAPPPPDEGGPWRLLLSHTPDQIGWAQRWRFPLMLAGHTHGGQVRLPLLGPIVAPSRYGVRYASGVFHEPPTLMHVSRGLAGLQPLRINCPPELAILTLRSPAG